MGGSEEELARRPRLPPEGLKVWVHWKGVTQGLSRTWQTQIYNIRDTRGAQLCQVTVIHEGVAAAKGSDASCHAAVSVP